MIYLEIYFSSAFTTIMEAMQHTNWSVNKSVNLL